MNPLVNILGARIVSYICVIKIEVIVKNVTAFFFRINVYSKSMKKINYALAMVLLQKKHVLIRSYRNFMDRQLHASMHTI